jgi:hypothetical protein
MLATMNGLVCGTPVHLFAGSEPVRNASEQAQSV